MDRVHGFDLAQVKQIESKVNGLFQPHIRAIGTAIHGLFAGLFTRIRPGDGGTDIWQPERAGSG